MARLRPVLVVAAIALGGCSSVSQTVRGWFGETPSPTPSPVTSRQGQVYYAAVDGLAVYDQSSSSSKVVGHLALHERVTRSRVERGYAYIAADRGGLTGWVDNAQLIWRLPGAASSTPGESAPAAGAAQVAEPTQAEAAPTEVPPTAAPPPAQPTPTSTAQTAPKRPAPSIFDPY